MTWISEKLMEMRENDRSKWKIFLCVDSIWIYSAISSKVEKLFVNIVGPSDGKLELSSQEHQIVSIECEIPHLKVMILKWIFKMFELSLMRKLNVSSNKPGKDIYEWGLEFSR